MERSIDSPSRDFHQHVQHILLQRGQDISSDLHLDAAIRTSLGRNNTETINADLRLFLRFVAKKNQLLHQQPCASAAECNRNTQRTAESLR